MIHPCSLESKLVNVVFVLICIKNLLAQNVREKVVLKSGK